MFITKTNKIQKTIWLPLTIGIFCWVVFFMIFENSFVFAQNQNDQPYHGSQQSGLLFVSPETASTFGLASSGSQAETGSPLPTPREPDTTVGMRVAEFVPFSVGGSLPNNSGQIGRAYDITPYTNRPTQSQSPQNTITNWVLRRTGPEIWHGEPFGFMSATRDKLVVYHTPEMQNYIAETVDRFVNTKNAQKTFSLRIISLHSPDWRNRNYTYLAPIRIDTPSVQGWLVSKTHVGLLLDNIAKRNDAREHVSSNSSLHNAQTTVVPYHATRNFVRDVQVRPSAPGGYITDPTSLTEGFQFEVTPLVSLDGKTLEARIKCDMVQVDKMHQLTINTPSSASPSAKVTIEVPQVANFSVDELISWPADTVLLLDLGIVPLLIPMPQQSPDKNLFEQIVSPLANSSPPKRSNVLMLIGLQTDVGTTNFSDVTTYPATQTSPNTGPLTDGPSSGLSISYDPEPSVATGTAGQMPPMTGNLYQNQQSSDASQLPPANPILSGQ